ncbi:sunset domain-containing protein [Saccharopolyspora sp. CA-218241]|uniref:sunset domain-containing protein n=1 Tax=Saccharopolyspora sp. CA-218241 TaxID=3240027 RepID=UPI003D99D359
MTTWLFTQVWLWSLAAFLLGSACTWLLFVRPLKRRLAEQYDDPYYDDEPAYDVEQPTLVPERPLDLLDDERDNEPPIGPWDRSPRPWVDPETRQFPAVDDRPEPAPVTAPAPEPEPEPLPDREPRPGPEPLPDRDAGNTWFRKPTAGSGAEFLPVGAAPEPLPERPGPPVEPAPTAWPGAAPASAAEAPTRQEPEPDVRHRDAPSAPGQDLAPLRPAEPARNGQAPAPDQDRPAELPQPPATQPPAPQVPAAQVPVSQAPVSQAPRELDQGMRRETRLTGQLRSLFEPVEPGDAAYTPPVGAEATQVFPAVEDTANEPRTDIHPAPEVNRATTTPTETDLDQADPPQADGTKADLDEAAQATPEQPDSDPGKANPLQAAQATSGRAEPAPAKEDPDENDPGTQPAEGRPEPEVNPDQADQATPGQAPADPAPAGRGTDASAEPEGTAAEGESGPPPLPRRTPGAGPRPGRPEERPGPMIKGHSASRQYHAPESPHYESIVADVWFRTPADAETAGFTAWNS